MPEYGDYKKRIKTLGELREFVNVTLGNLEDDYTFDIDDNFTGVDITLCANCDVSYSEKSFYWTTNSKWYSELMETVEQKIELKHKAKALEIILGIIKNEEYGTQEELLKACEDVYGKGSKEFELLKEVLE